MIRHLRDLAARAQTLVSRVSETSDSEAARRERLITYSAFDPPHHESSAASQRYQRMLTSYHNHTNWSDGRPTLAELIGCAQQTGITELGISDHYVMHPSQLVEWSMPLDFIDEYA